MYTFNHRSSGNLWPQWSGDALHGYEVDHVFGVPFRDSRYTYSDDERTLSDRMITFWTNFAKTGYVGEMSYRTRFHKSPIHTADADVTKLSSRVASAV